MPVPPKLNEAGPPPEAWGPALRLLRLATTPLERFLQIEASSGVALIVVAGIALLWANSGWAESYEAVWGLVAGIRLGSWSFERSLHWVVNDGLMTIFFFVVGLEIRREIACGELSDWRRAALPLAAALGGMIAPAGLYLAVVGSGPARDGWGVPMATDIAFALGVLALLGKRVPAGLRVLLLALAVVDDLGAILVIALVYSDGISLSGLLMCGLGLFGTLVLQRFGIRSKVAYIFPALVAWAGAYAAGIHPTIAGVAIGLMTPVRAWLGKTAFVAEADGKLRQLERINASKDDDEAEVASVLNSLSDARREAVSPAEFLIEALHPWVAFAIMPLFALANAGVVLGGVSLEGEALRVVLGVALGLVIGKPLGVVLVSWLFVRLGLASMPEGIQVRHLVVLGFVAGIGFTMSLFIAQLAFSEGETVAAAKLGILLASGAAAALGLGLGRLLLRPPEGGATESADDADS